MTEPKTYEIPESIQLLLDKSMAAATMRDRAIKLPIFGFRKACKCAVDHLTFKRLFWQKVYELYPELDGKSLTYTSYTGTVTELQETNTDKE